MLIHNVATTDGLANGACGKVIGVEQTEHHVDKIIVEFDNPKNAFIWFAKPCTR